MTPAALRHYGLRTASIDRAGFVLVTHLCPVISRSRAATAHRLR